MSNPPSTRSPRPCAMARAAETTRDRRTRRGSAWRAMWPLLVLPALLLAGCGGGPRTPREAVDRLVDAAQSEDYGGIWDLMSPTTQIRAEHALEELARSVQNDDEAALAIFGHPADRVRRMNGRQRFVAVMRTGHSQNRLAADAAALERATIGAPQVDGDRATVSVQIDDRQETIELVRHDGEWRIDGSAVCGAPPGASSTWLVPLLLVLPLLLAARRRG